jgi:Tfp pilus assembly protein PilF
MFADHVKLLFQLYTRPLRAMSGILDVGSCLFAAVLAFIVSYFLFHPIPGISAFTPLLLGAVAFVPACIFVVTRIETGTAFEQALFRDYAPLLACTYMAWTAANIPALLLGSLSPLLIVAGFVYFAGLMVCALRVIFGLSWWKAGATTIVALVLAAATLLLYAQFRFITGYLFSPFVLFYAYRFFSGDVASLGRGLQARQSFRRNLEAATVNPRDADAHTQLGLIYQQRHQYDQAIERFERAVSIDPNDAEAHLQLGRIARDQGRLEDAIGHFQASAKIDVRHSSHEVLRDYGGVQLQLGNFDIARQSLQPYIEKRPYDPEGQYYYGEALRNLGMTIEAKAAYEACIEAVNTAPSHRRRQLQKWKKLAEVVLANQSR